MKTSLTHCPGPAWCPPCPVPPQPREQSDQRPIFTDAAGDWGGRGHTLGPPVADLRGSHLLLSPQEGGQEAGGALGRGRRGTGRAGGAGDPWHSIYRGSPWATLTHSHTHTHTYTHEGLSPTGWAQPSREGGDMPAGGPRRPLWHTRHWEAGGRDGGCLHLSRRVPGGPGGHTGEKVPRVSPQPHPRVTPAPGVSPPPLPGTRRAGDTREPNPIN